MNQIFFFDSLFPVNFDSPFSFAKFFTINIDSVHPCKFWIYNSFADLYPYIIDSVIIDNRTLTCKFSLCDCSVQIFSLLILTQQIPVNFEYMFLLCRSLNFDFAILLCKVLHCQYWLMYWLKMYVNFESTIILCRSLPCQLCFNNYCVPNTFLSILTQRFFWVNLFPVNFDSSVPISSVKLAFFLYQSLQFWPSTYFVLISSLSVLYPSAMIMAYHIKSKVIFYQYTIFVSILTLWPSVPNASLSKLTLWFFCFIHFSIEKIISEQLRYLLKVWCIQ